MNVKSVVWKIGVVLLVAIACLPATGCAIAERMGGISDAKTLQQIGTPAEATIVEIWDTGVSINDDPVVGFLLEVRPEGREAYRAKTKLLVSKVHIPQFQPGRVVPVRVDPNDPNHVALDVYQFGK